MPASDQEPGNTADESAAMWPYRQEPDGSRTHIVDPDVRTDALRGGQAGKRYQGTRSSPRSRLDRAEPVPSRALRPALLVPLLLVVVPLLGAVIAGPSLGLAFTLACAAAAVGAALLSTLRGLWWAVPSTPVVLLAVAFAWVGYHGLNQSRSTAAAATDIFQGIAGAFPGIAAGTVAALAVTGYRAATHAALPGGKRG